MKIKSFALILFFLTSTVHADIFFPRETANNPFTRKLQFIYPTINSLEDTPDNLISIGGANRLIKINPAGDEITSDTGIVSDVPGRLLSASGIFGIGGISTERIFFDFTTSDTVKMTSDTGVSTYQTQMPVDSLTGFQVLDVDGGIPIFNVDTTNERVGIGTNTPDTSLTVDSNSNTQSLRLLGAAASTEIVDFFVGPGGQLIVTTVPGSDTARWIELRSESSSFGLMLMESDGTGTDTYANLHVTDAASDYLNIVITDAASTIGLVVAEGGNVGIGTTTPSDRLDLEEGKITDVGGLHFKSAVEATISSGAITITEGHIKVDTEADATDDDLDTITSSDPGEILFLLPADDARTVRIRNGVGNIYLKHQTDSSPFSFSSPSGAGAVTRYAGGGWYDFATADVTLDEGSLTQTFGTSNVSYAAHASIISRVNGTVDTGTVSIVVSGTSIDDEGNRATGASETILADITTAGINGYHETTKKWLGTITYTLTETVDNPTAYTIDFNYGFSKYEDFANQAFTVTGIQVAGEAGASDSGFNIILFHHSTSGWTYAATGFVPGGTQLANMNTDHSTEQDLSNAEPFAWKKTDLNTDVDGNNGEGVVVRIDTSSARAVESMSGIIWVHTQPAFSYLNDTKQHLIFMKHGSNWLEL